MGKWRRAHGPTWLVAAATYLGWILLTLEHRALPTPILFLLGGWIIAWQGSLQHETIHGHPSRWPLLRALVGWPPLSLWLPYDMYRDTHLAHHRSQRLGEPGHDPESHHVEMSRWESASLVLRWLMVVNQTLLGRLTVGPLITIIRFVGEQLKAPPSPHRRRVWLVHALAVATILSWLTLVCHLSLAKYLACFVYPGLALTLLRSFAEHGPRGERQERTASVVSRGFGVLFLHNNLHIAHHTAPQLPWFELPRFFQAHQETFVGSGRGHVYVGGYWEVLKRYALRPSSSPTGTLGDTAREIASR